MNREVNCKVNEFATESTEAQILKGTVCVLVNNTRDCALELNQLNNEIVSIVSSMFVLLNK